MQRIVNLVDFEKCRKMLKNAPTLAIAAVDTEEDEPLKIWGDLFSYSDHSLIARQNSFFFSGHPIHQLAAMNHGCGDIGSGLRRDLPKTYPLRVLSVAWN